MPQMAPMNWWSLFLMIITTLMMFNTMNFFVYQYKPLYYTFTPDKKSVNWKW